MRVIIPGDQTSNKPCYITVGVFDGVHRGHCALLEFLKQQAHRNGCKAVAVTFPSHPLTQINPAINPGALNTVAEKLYRLELTGLDDCMLVNFNASLMAMTAGEFLDHVGRWLDVRGIIAGFDHSFGRKNAIGIEQAAFDKGIRFHRFTQFKTDSGVEISSTAVRKRITDGAIEDANSLLGYQYTLTGTVTHGKALGREIGFPTANLIPVDEGKLLPGNGVYVCRASIGEMLDRQFAAMVNIGHNPTVEEKSTVSIETHIIGLNGETDLYGAEVTLHFVRFLRAEKRFNSVDELHRQLTSDRHATLQILNLSNNQ